MRTILLFFIVFPFVLLAQNPSIHQLQLQEFDKTGTQSPDFWRHYWQYKPIEHKKQTCKLQKLVFGWHPYWMNGLEGNYRWDLLSDLAYFGAEISSSTGDLLTTHDWKTASVVDEAQQHGVRVHLTAILFSGHDQFFSSSEAQSNAISQLVEAVVDRNANGINLDFEGMGSDNRAEFTDFVSKLRKAMDEVDTSLILSIALMPVDWNSVYDIGELNKYVDLFIIMGYDYYWSGSDEAGPTGQLYPLSGFKYTEARSIADYLYKGVSPEKLLLGVPYYGFKWQTTSGTVPASVVDYVGVVIVKYMYTNYGGVRLDPKSRSEYSAYNDSVWYQVWVDRDLAMRYKYKVVWQTGIAGIGIWALGYDDGRTEMWNAIEQYFSGCGQPVADTVWDLGGPMGEYWNNEDYEFWVQADSLRFENVDIEAGYDTLMVYGCVDSQLVLLKTLSGNYNDDVLLSENKLFKVRIKTDGRTTGAGWTMITDGGYFTTAPEEENRYDITVIGKIYPNPATNYIKLGGAEQGFYYVIANLEGNVVRTGFYNGQIGISGLVPGIYILRYFANGKVYVGKFVKI